MTYVDARCPLRPGDISSLCVPGASGPADCPTVAEAMRGPALRERLAELQRDAVGTTKARPVASQ